MLGRYVWYKRTRHTYWCKRVSLLAFSCHFLFAQLSCYLLLIITHCTSPIRPWHPTQIGQAWLDERQHLCWSVSPEPNPEPTAPPFPRKRRGHHSVVAIFLMFSWMFVVSSCSYRLRVLDVGQNPPCTVRSFLFLMSVTSIALFDQLIISRG